MARVEDMVGERKSFADVPPGGFFQLLRGDIVWNCLKAIDRDGDYNCAVLTEEHLHNLNTTTEVLHYPQAFLQTMGVTDSTGLIVQPASNNIPLSSLPSLSVFRFIGSARSGGASILRTCIKLGASSPHHILAVDFETGEIFETRGNDVHHLPDARIQLFPVAHQVVSNSNPPSII